MVISPIQSASGDAIAVRPQALREKIAKLFDVDRPRFERLWAYYRNPMRVCAADADDAGSNRPYRQAQEWGLPSRITGVRSGQSLDATQIVDGIARKEVVIENDIAWRVDTMIDYLFGRAIVIDSAAADPARRAQISQLLRLILAHNGGIVFLQQLALLGSVYGFVDVLVKLDCASTPVAERPDSSDSEKIHPVAQTSTNSVESRSACGGAIDNLGEPPACTHDAHTDGAPPSDPLSAEPAPGVGEAPTTASAATIPSQDDALLARLARRIRLEIVEPARALPLLSCDDWRVVDAYVQVYETPRKPAALRSTAKWFERFLPHFAAVRSSAGSRDSTLVAEILTPTTWSRFEDEKLIAQGENSLGEIPLVHVQNVAVPFEYAGAGDVEPLLPLQDELNTRLSDRANRITLQSFKMYLGKGIENFTSLPIAPGQMWMTDNEQADVIQFGGDANCPSEESHIGELREALDKASGVSPIAAGAIKGRIGRLTSAAALRVTMLALLAKTEKKRTTYGAAVQRMCELALLWLDRAGLFATTPDERRVELHWPSPIPENQQEKLDEAQTKLRLGIPQDVVLRELGY